jgi:L-amino acid N-acyltransferase YncA
MIRYITEKDSVRILEIYRKGLDTDNASFEIEAPSWEDWGKKYHNFCQLAWEDEGLVHGWATLAPVSARHCYHGVAEVSLYVDPKSQRKGIASYLMSRLIEESEANGIWTLYSSIFPENVATRNLHLKHGFREVGSRERIAQRNGRWRDTLILERRSTLVGN